MTWLRKISSTEFENHSISIEPGNKKEQQSKTNCNCRLQNRIALGTYWETHKFFRHKKCYQNMKLSSKT